MVESLGGCDVCAGRLFCLYIQVLYYCLYEGYKTCDLDPIKKMSQLQVYQATVSPACPSVVAVKPVAFERRTDRWHPKTCLPRLIPVSDPT